MASAMSAHTGVGVSSLAAPDYRVEVELIAAKSRPAGGAAVAAPEQRLRRWGADNLAQAVEVPAAARLLFTAGLVGTRKDGSLPDSAADQCKQVYGASVSAAAAHLPSSCLCLAVVRIRCIFEREL